MPISNLFVLYCIPMYWFYIFSVVIPPWSISYSSLNYVFVQLNIAPIKISCFLFLLIHVICFINANLQPFCFVMVIHIFCGNPSLVIQLFIFKLCVCSIEYFSNKDFLFPFSPNTCNLLYTGWVSGWNHKHSSWYYYYLEIIIVYCIYLF